MDQYLPQAFGQAYVEAADGDQHKIGVVTDMSLTPEEGTAEEVATTEGTVTRRQNPGPGAATFTVQPQPGSLAEDLLDEAHSSGRVISIHVRQYKANTIQVGGGGKTVAIAAAAQGKIVAVVTGVNTDFKTGPAQAGMHLVVGGKLHPIVSIESDVKMTVALYGPIAAKVATKNVPRTGPEAVNATADWSIVEVQQRDEYTGRITSAGGFSQSGASVSGAIAMDLTASKTRTLATP